MLLVVFSWPYLQYVNRTGEALKTKMSLDALPQISTEDTVWIENYVNMRVKELHSDIIWLLILQLMLLFMCID